MMYAFNDLSARFGDSRLAIGFIEPSSLEVIYANAAFAQRIEVLHMATGVNPLSDWPEVLDAMRESFQHQRSTSCELQELAVRMEFFPAQLQQAGSETDQVVLCHVLPLEGAASLKERMFQDVLDFSPHNAWACSLKGEVFWTNRTSNLFTYGQREMHDLTHSRYIHKIHPDDLQETATRFSTAMVEGKLEPFRYRLRDLQGNFHWFLFAASAVQDAQDNTRFWSGCSVNINAFVEEEAQLRDALAAKNAENQRLRLQLQEAQQLVANVQKMELVSHLAGGVAHDLNNMLFVMSMHMGSLQKRLVDSTLLDNVAVVRECIRKAARLSSQLSAFSGRLPQNAQPLSPQKMLEDAREMFVQAVGAEVVFNVHAAEPLPNVLADRMYLENALINLLINARDAVDGRGHIALTVSEQVLQREGVDQRFVCFSVSDDGTGMSEAMQAQMFEPFFTTKAPDKGTGLGLAMVKNFIESSGGMVQVQSSLGQGTTMHLYLPITNLVAQDVNEQLPTPKPGQGAVMLVEDNDTVRQAISLALREMGYSLVAAKNLDQALALLEAGTTADLLLSDIRMPGRKNVRDLIGYMEQRPAPIPMIFMTGYSADIAIEEGLIDGRYPVLFKPFAVAELVKKMHEVMGLVSVC